MSYTTSYYVFAATGDSLLSAEADKEMIVLARRLNMLEHDEEDSCIGKVNFTCQEDEFDFDTAAPTRNSWQFTVQDTSDSSVTPTWRVEVYLEGGGVTPDNVATIIPAMWQGRERSFASPEDAIAHLVVVEKARETFNNRNSEACRNALAIYAQRSRWWTGCLPFGESNPERVHALMEPVRDTIKFFRAAEQEGNKTKMALFTTLVADGYTLSEAVETTAAALAD